MKNISKVLMFMASSAVLVGCVDDGMYTTGSVSRTPPRTSYHTGSGTTYDPSGRTATPAARYEPAPSRGYSTFSTGSGAPQTVRPAQSGSYATGSYSSSPASARAPAASIAPSGTGYQVGSEAPADAGSHVTGGYSTGAE